MLQIRGLMERAGEIYLELVNRQGPTRRRKPQVIKPGNHWRNMSLEGLNRQPPPVVPRNHHTRPANSAGLHDSDAVSICRSWPNWRSGLPPRFTQPTFQNEIKMIASSAFKAQGVHTMEWADDTRLRCLVVSSKDPAHLKTVIGMLHDHGIQTEEGLHRPWRSAGFESSVMVAPEDYPKASVLYEELEIPPGTCPALVASLAPSRLTQRGKRKLLPEFFARHKQPEPTDSGGSWENRASG
jgi:hypothetical protein